ncbi:hypothetical protein D3C85_1874720 [compost metagenome]
MVLDDALRLYGNLILRFADHIQPARSRVPIPFISQKIADQIKWDEDAVINIFRLIFIEIEVIDRD